MTMIAVAVLLVLTPASPKGDEAIQGTWAVVRYETDGRKTPEDQLRRTGFRLRFDGDPMEERYRSVPPTGMAGRIRLDPTTAPRSIDLSEPPEVERPATMPGIYEIKGEALRICFGDVQRPKSFPAEGDRPALFIVCERVKP